MNGSLTRKMNKVMQIRLLFFLLSLSLIGRQACAHDPTLHFVPPAFERSAEKHFYDNWLGKTLQVLGEKSIWARTLAENSTHTYRITKIPSLSGMPTSVRIDISGEGLAEIVVHAPGVEKLEEKLSADPSKEEILNAIREQKQSVILSVIDKRISEIGLQIQNIDFWTDVIDGHERKDVEAKHSFLDGNAYFIEASYGGKFKIVLRNGCWIEDDLIDLVEMFAKIGNVKRLGNGC